MQWVAHFIRTESEETVMSVSPCCHSVARPWVVVGGKASRYRGYLWIHWVSSCGQLTKGGPPAWELDRVPTGPLDNNLWCDEPFHKYVGWGGMDWIDLAQDRTGGGHLWLWQRAVVFHNIRGISWLTENLLSFWRSTLLCGDSYFVGWLVS